MKAPQFRELRVADVKPADYNPANRVLKEHIRELIDSMSRVGILYPILVNTKNQVIDGHRRLAAAAELGWETIPGVVTDADADDLYATVNATARRMNGNDALNVWLKRPRAVTPLLRARFENMLEVFGARRMDRIARSGGSIKTFNFSRQLAAYCGREDSEFVCAVADWLMEHPVARVAQQAMASGEKPATIAKAVRDNRPLRMVAMVS